MRQTRLQSGDGVVVAVIENGRIVRGDRKPLPSRFPVTLPSELLRRNGLDPWGATPRAKRAN